MEKGNISIHIVIEKISATVLMTTSRDRKMKDISADVSSFLDEFVVLYFNGVLLKSYDTPMSLGMKNHDKIISKELNAGNAQDYILGRMRTQSL